MTLFKKLSLPQFADNLGERKDELNSLREKFQYDFSAIKNVPISATLPEEAKAGTGWSLKIIAAEYGIRRNWEALIEENDYVFEKPLPQKSVKELAGYVINSDLTSILDYTDPFLGVALKDKRPESFEDYFELFKKIPLPKDAPALDDDKAFANYFVAGLNPVLIEGVSELKANYSLTDEHVDSNPSFGGETVESLVSDGRLFVVDYKELKDIKAGVHPDQPKFVYAPIVYLAMPAGSENLEVLAIQYGQDSDTPVATPSSGKWDWMAAKTMTRVANVTHHEYLTHLGLTHLLIDPVVLATFRHLPSDHPLNALLLPHFEGTLPINALAVKKLLFREGTLDRTFAAEYEAGFDMLSQVRNKYKFRENFFPKTFEKRSVEAKGKLANYPYRDDGLEIWNAIQQWMTDYVDLYYKTDSDVVEDFELQNWASEIASPEFGRVFDFLPEDGMSTRRTLIETLTMIVFTASAQHAAVNFPQAHTAIVSLEPGAGYAPMPTSLGLTEKEAVDFLPPLDRAIKQMHLFHLLGNTYYTELGQYSLGTFSDKRVVPSLWKFQKALKKIESNIDDRNKKRPYAYKHLKPSHIPQSINI